MNVGLTLLAAICVLAPRHAPAQGNPPAEIFATVDGFNVTAPYLQRYMENHQARGLMEAVIRAQVVDHEALVQGVTPSHDEVTAELSRRRAQFVSDDDFAYHVQQLGYTPKGYREQVRTELALGALLDRAASVSDDKAKAYYDQHLSEFSSETELHILHLATKTQADALAAFRSLVDGTPFEVAARRFSAQQPPESGGDLGWVTKDTIPVKGLWEVAHALEQGDTSEPFELDGQYHVVRLAGVRPGGLRTFDEAKDDIKRKLREGAGLSEEDYVTSLLAKAQIRLYWAPVSYLQDEYAQLKQIRIAVNGRTLRLSPAPYINERGVMLAPAKQVLQGLGAAVQWRSGAKSLEVKRGNTTATLALGESAAVVNGQVMDIGAAPLLKDQVLFVPVRGIVAICGASMSWNAVTKLISITAAVAAPPPAAKAEPVAEG